jgi:hypothetical protein
MAGKESTTQRFIESLAGIWNPHYSRQARHLVKRLERKFQARVDIQEPENNALHFLMDLSDIHLQGMDGVHCLLLAGNDSSINRAMRGFWAEFNAPGTGTFVLTLSELAYKQAQTILPNGRCLILSPRQLEEMLTTDDPGRS